MKIGCHFPSLTKLFDVSLQELSPVSLWSRFSVFSVGTGVYQHTTPGSVGECGPSEIFTVIKRSRHLDFQMTTHRVNSG